MYSDKVFTGATEDEIWQQISTDLTEDTLEYHALIEQGNQKIILNIDIDLGGGFEGGYATTGFSSPLTNPGFRFAIHEEHFTDEIGKFFGMQDVKIGYPDFDHHLIVKTNDEEKVKTIFTNEVVRQVFTDLSDFDFGIRLHDVEDSDNKQAYLELNVDDGINNLDQLRGLYHAFYEVLIKI